jgi:predicted nucleic acid-binding protein
VSKPFIDSNVVLYLLSGDAAKADRAEAILQAGGVISVQVLNEVASVCRRKLKMPWEEVDALLLAVKTACEILPLTLASHEKAVELAKRFQLALYDANIVATALASGAKVLLSEDMQSGMLIDGLLIQNPFIGASS